MSNPAEGSKLHLNHCNAAWCCRPNPSLLGF